MRYLQESKGVKKSFLALPTEERARAIFEKVNPVHVSGVLYRYEDTTDGHVEFRQSLVESGNSCDYEILCNKIKRLQANYPGAKVDILAEREDYGHEIGHTGRHVITWSAADYNFSEIDEEPGVQYVGVLNRLSDDPERRAEQTAFYKALDPQERAIFRACCSNTGYSHSRDNFDSVREMYEEKKYNVYYENLPDKEEFDAYAMKQFGEFLVEEYGLESEIDNLPDPLCYCFDYAEYARRTILEGNFENANYWTRNEDGRLELNYMTVEFYN